MEWKNVKEKLKYHLGDTTALITESTPVYALLEKCNPITPMSDDMSINTRLFALALGFSGLGFIYSQGRDLSKRIFKITDHTKEKIHGVHDFLYNAAFNLVLSPPIYAVSQTLAGEDLDWTKIAVGTCIAIGVGAINGAPQGYNIDMFRDLIGLKNCKRKSYPNFVKKRSSKVKKLIATGLVAGAIGLTGLIYSLTPENKPNFNNPVQSTIEQQVNVVNPRDSSKSLEVLLK